MANRTSNNERVRLLNEQEISFTHTRDLLLQAEQRMEKEGFSKLSIDDIKQAALKKYNE